MQRTRLIGMWLFCLTMILIVYRFRWRVFGSAGIGPPERACEDSQVFNAYLKTGGNPSAYIGRQPFIKCVAEGGSYEMVAKLIERGVDVDAETLSMLVPIPIYFSDIGTTALYAAVERGDYEIAKLLFENGADINLSRVTDSPLNATLVYNRPKILQLFLEANGLDYEFNITRLASRADDADIEIFRLLFEANIPFQQGALSTSLRNAASTGRLDLIKLLIAEGADVNQSPETRRPSALHEAARGNYLDVAEFLIDAGANVNALARAERTPLHQAVMMNHLEIAKLLIQHGANVEMTNIHGNTALDIAIENNNLDMIELLERK